MAQLEPTPPPLPAAVPEKGHPLLTGPAREIFANLGPGLITGAADDDPSGISTYAVSGAAFGYAPLWTMLFSFPLMTAVQLMCARLGMVSGRGLAGVVRRRYPHWVLWSACALLLVANTVNIAADLGGMAASLSMVTPVPALVWTPLFGIVIASFLVWSSYVLIARIFKWLTLVLLAYVLTSFFAHPNWGQVLRATVVPHIEWSGKYLAVLVGIFGTTISPYLFFWQASQEVEEERAIGRKTLSSRRGATAEELRRSRTDIVTGMFFSNMVAYFIILTTAATLHAHGKTSIATAQEAAEALRPLAGAGAYWLFTLGVIGAGMLGVPVLAGSSAYAVSEAAAWKSSMKETPRSGRRFYLIIAVSMALGMAINYMGLDAVAMLFWSAVVNGVLAPPLIVLVILLTGDPKVMGNQPSSAVTRGLGWVTAAVMAAAAIAMFVLSAKGIA